MSHCYQRESPVGLKGEGRAGLHQPGPGSRLAMEAGAPGLVSQGRTRPQRACAAGGGRRERTSISGHNPLPSYANDSTQELSFQNLGDTTMKSSGTEGGCARSRSRRADGRTDGQAAWTLAAQHPASLRHPHGGLGPAAPGGPRRGPDPISPTPSPRRRGPDASPRHLHLGPPPRGNLGRRPSLPAWGRGGGGAGRGHGGARRAAGRVRGDKAHRLASARPRRPPRPAPARLRGRPGPTIMAAPGALRPPEPRPGGAAACGAGRGGAASGASREGAAAEGREGRDGKAGRERRDGRRAALRQRLRVKRGGGCLCRSRWRAPGRWR